MTIRSRQMKDRLRRQHSLREMGGSTLYGRTEDFCVTDKDTEGASLSQAPPHCRAGRPGAPVCLARLLCVVVVVVVVGALGRAGD